jgi:hypothetical protein
MNNKRKIIIIAVVVLFFVFLIVGNLLIPKDTLEPTPTPFLARKAPGNSYFSTDKEMAEEFILEEDTITAGGGKVSNFYRDSSNISPKGDVLLVESEKYDIFYFKNDDIFLISIVSSPFNEARKEAEKIFLNELAINEETACKLNVVETTPEFVNPDEATKKYPLSFCE